MVIVGTHFRGFERLVSKADEIAGNIAEEFVIQIGSTSILPKNSKYFRAASYAHLLELMAQARVIVCHAGAGCVLDCLTSGKRPIVVPRLKRLGEARDDHQLELASFLEEQGKAIKVVDINQLEQAIRGVEEPVAPSLHIQASLTSSLKRFLEHLSERIDGKR